MIHIYIFSSPGKFLHINVCTCVYTYTGMCVCTRKTILKQIQRVSEEQVNEMVAGERLWDKQFSKLFSEGRSLSYF